MNLKLEIEKKIDEVVDREECLGAQDIATGVMEVLQYSDFSNCKVYNKYMNPLLRDYNLSKFAKESKNYPLYLLISDFLKGYGINIWGYFKIDEKLKLRALSITKYFNIENFEIIKQFYGYNNLKIDILLAGFVINSGRSSCYIEYNTESEVIALKELSYGTEIFRKEYSNFNELWEHVKMNDNLDELKESINK